MQFHYWYHMWTTGTYEVSVTIPLQRERRYLVTGYLTQTDGDDYAHVYISRVCHWRHDDLVTCGIRDDGDDRDLPIVEVVSGARDVTVKLKTRGGQHRAEGVVYEI